MSARWSPSIDHVDDTLADDEVDRARRDPEVFAAVFTRYQPEIERFLLARTNGDRALAEDMTSQTFTRAWAALDRYEAGSERGWLYQIARNLLIDHLRKRQADRLDPDIPLTSAAPTLDEAVIAQEARDQLHAAIGVLTEPQRSIIILRLHGHTSREIAFRLGLGHEAVKSAQYRAMAKLKRALAPLHDQRETS